MSKMKTPRLSRQTERGLKSEAGSDRYQHRNAPPCDCNLCAIETMLADFRRAEIAIALASEMEATQCVN